jgi:2-haloacid dehalogenase
MTGHPAIGLDRRRLLQLAAGGAAMTTATRVLAAADRPVRAIVFDAFPVFDPRSVAAAAEAHFPGRGGELAAAWRVRLFDYQWLRLAGRRYKDFRGIAEDSLVVAAAALKLDLRLEARDALVGAYSALRAWPDVKPALQALRGAGIKLGFCSNMTEAMLRANIASAGLDGLFDRVISTDGRRTYKPAPEAYQMAIDGFGLAREEIVFAPFAGWDAAGAKWFGYRTFWVNRANQPVEQLDAIPDATGTTLTELAAFVGVQV